MNNMFFYGDHVDTDVIIPARYLNVSDEDILKQYCMIDIDETFASEVKQGDLIIAGENFGCGSSREHAPIAIKASGIQCVIAKSFARIFFRNAFNIGLPVIESPELVEETKENHQLDIDFINGKVINRTLNKTYTITPLPPFMLKIIESGGLVNYIGGK